MAVGDYVQILLMARMIHKGYFNNVLLR